MTSVEKETKTIFNNGTICEIDKCSSCIDLIAINNGTLFSCKKNRDIIMKYFEIKEKINEDCPL
jgi:hypothetical protein